MTPSPPQVADWVELMGSERRQLIMEDGRGVQVSPLHDIPTFARAAALRRRFPGLRESSQPPMVIQTTVIGTRK